MDVAVLVLRAAVGLTLAAHGAAKLWGWFGGHGLDRTAGFLESLGFRPARTWAGVLGVSELVGGLLLTLGLLTPLGAAAAVGVMTAAIAVVHRPKGFWVDAGGAEYPLILAVTAAVLAWMGPGAYALDPALGLGFEGLPAALFAAVVGVVAGLGVATLARTRAGVPAGSAQAQTG